MLRADSYSVWNIEFLHQSNNNLCVLSLLKFVCQSYSALMEDVLEKAPDEYVKHHYEI